MASTSLHTLPGGAEFLSALSKRELNSNKLPRNYFDAGRDKEPRYLYHLSTEKLAGHLGS